MTRIRIVDGPELSLQEPTSGLDLAKQLGKNIKREALLVRVNGELRDIRRPINETDLDGDGADAACIEFLGQDRSEVIDVMRHDCAHVLAMAVQRLFKRVQITFGPVTEEGFYYDFHRQEPFSTDDFPRIEAEMRKIVDENHSIQRELWDQDEAIRYFRDQGESFKAEWVQELPKDAPITIYRQGEWLDLCRGPHLPSTGGLGKAFKLMKLSGSYWRGDSNRPQLQRIYGTWWPNKQDLEVYLFRLEEAEKRDHRKLGRQLGLFHLQEEARGSVFWHPNGWTLWQTAETYLRKRLRFAGYEEIRTPQLVDRVLWERSGHWEKYRPNMFIVEVNVDRDQEVSESDGTAPDAIQATESKAAPQSNAEAHHYALKPMNCPCHVQVFRQGIRSFRDLPMRLSEFGACHRYEPSGALHGLMRVRAFTQDDAHIFCAKEQIGEETNRFIELLSSVYKDFGFDEFRILFSDRPEVRVGSEEVWDEAEQALKQAALAVGVELTENPGDGAFYGPKLDFILKDAVGREWQCGTLQCDFILPERMDAGYVDSQGKKQRPVMLHRAILGSMERFMGILIENYAGKFPMWLAPVQVKVASIITEVNPYVEEVTRRLFEAGIRAEADVRNEKIGYKIREHAHMKVPVTLVVGKRERDDGEVAIRRLGSSDNLVLPLEEAVQQLVVEGRVPQPATS